MEARIQTIHHALKQNARSVMDDLQIEATEMKETMQTERQQHREQLSEMYSSLLDKFLQSSEVIEGRRYFVRNMANLIHYLCTIQLYVCEVNLNVTCICTKYTVYSNPVRRPTLSTTSFLRSSVRSVQEIRLQKCHRLKQLLQVDRALPHLLVLAIPVVVPVLRHPLHHLA